MWNYEYEDNMNILVGYTGFVGSNIYEKGNFDRVFNSKNIEDAYGLEPDLLVYAGLRAEKYLANRAPERDMEQIVQAAENIRKIAPKKLVLISTIDIFRDPQDADEHTLVDTGGLHAYGLNRYRLECMVREAYPDALMIRLPALFGRNIKKNFIYDYLKRIPFMLTREKYEELCSREERLHAYYVLQENGYYRCRELNPEEERELRKMFQQLGFSALYFTDSRSRYQFYPLGRLWGDIQTALQAGLTLWHPAVEPVSAGELYESLEGERFVNELPGVPATYDYKTLYAGNFGGSEGYIMDKAQVIGEIRAFVSEEMRERDEE